MKVLTRYRLELHWDRVEYSKDDTAVLKGAYFTGRVLKNAARINEEDQLVLDMTAQHLILPAMADYYQAVLKWRGVEYKEDRVCLREACIKGKYVNSLEKLEDSDWVLINCKGHEEKDHPHLLVYWAEVHKRDKERKF